MESPGARSMAPSTRIFRYTEGLRMNDFPFVDFGFRQGPEFSLTGATVGGRVGRQEGPCGVAVGRKQAPEKNRRGNLADGPVVPARWPSARRSKMAAETRAENRPPDRGFQEIPIGDARRCGRAGRAKRSPRAFRFFSESWVVQSVRRQ